MQISLSDARITNGKSTVQLSADDALSLRQHVNLASR